MVSTALLMIDADEQGDVCAAWFDVAGKSVICRQLMQLKRMGITRFIISINAMNDRIRTFSDEIKDMGIKVEYVQTLHALGDILGKNDQFLMISEAILTNDQTIKLLMTDSRNQILALENSDQYATFELIDLNHRWSGVAKIDGALIVSLEDMPMESDIHSTLLRLALQNGCPLTMVTPAEDEILKIHNQDDAMDLTEKYIVNMHKEAGTKGIMESYILKPLSYMTLPKLWAAKSADLPLQYGALALGLLSISMMALQFYVLAFGFAFAAGCTNCLKGYYNYFGIKRRRDQIGGVALSLMFLSTFLLSISVSGAWMHYCAVTLLFLLANSARYLYFNEKLSRFALSFSDIFFILMIASIWNLQIFAIWSLTLISAFWIFAGAISMNRHSVNQSADG